MDDTQYNTTQTSIQAPAAEFMRVDKFERFLRQKMSACQLFTNGVIQCRPIYIVVNVLDRSTINVALV